MTWTILIPAEIPSQNETERGRTHIIRASIKRRIRNQWCWMAQCLMAEKGIPRATGPRRLILTAYRVQRCRDVANLIGGAKACIDGLVDACLLQDDGDAHARITYRQDVASASPRNPGAKPRDRVATVIEIEDAP